MCLNRCLLLKKSFPLQDRSETFELYFIEILILFSKSGETKINWPIGLALMESNLIDLYTKVSLKKQSCCPSCATNERNT